MPTEQDIIDAITSDKFSHTRQGTGCWRDLVWIYHFDPASPSHFKLICSGDVNVVDSLLKKYQKPSSLSPTEPR